MTTHAAALIGGIWEDGHTPRDVIDPGNGQRVGTVAVMGRADAERAADAAAHALSSWSATTARYRADILLNAAEILRERAAGMADTLAREAGKRLPEAEGEIAFSGEYLRWFAEEARRGSDSIGTAERSGRRHLVVHRPAGVAASLTPWNFPVSIQARKLAPMLAAGCTVVARVSELAPIAATEFVSALNDAGLPPGVLNLVHGSGREITEGYLSHNAVRVVSFTGSTEVGRSIMALASRRVVRPLLELGGNAPFLVFGDADLEAAVEGAVVARLRNSGQSCVAANRFIVHASVAEEFTRLLAARFDALTVGHGLGDGGASIPDVGPVISAERVAEISSLVDDAVERGGAVIAGEGSVPTTGSFLRPTLIAGAPRSARLWREEVFGPVAGVWTFDSDEEAFALANDTEMGLAGYAWTRDADRVWKLAEDLDVGILGINDPVPSVVFAPMGGTKQSGIGREGASVGMEEFQETRHIAWS